MPDSAQTAANDLAPYWMPFTANRQFKRAPRLFVAAEGLYYTTDDGRKVLDGISGMWCVNAGHGRREIVEAIRAQAGRLPPSLPRGCRRHSPTWAPRDRGLRETPGRAGRHARRRRPLPRKARRPIRRWWRPSIRRRPVCRTGRALLPCRRRRRRRSPRP